MSDHEVIWATSTTGDDFQCVHVDAWNEAQAEIAKLKAALTPFAALRGHIDPSWPDDQSSPLLLTIGDFRRARAALSNENEKG